MRTTAILVMFLLPFVYVLSYAPLYHWADPPILVASSQGFFSGRATTGYVALPWHCYTPVDWLIDQTPLRQPLLSWASCWGVYEEMELDSFFRRELRAATLS